MRSTENCSWQNLRVYLRVRRAFQVTEMLHIPKRTEEKAELVTVSLPQTYFFPKLNKLDRTDSLFLSFPVSSADLIGSSAGSTSLVPCICATGSFCTEPSAASPPLPQHGTSTLVLLTVAGTSRAGFAVKKSEGRICIWWISTGLCFVSWCQYCRVFLWFSSCS